MKNSLPPQGMKVWTKASSGSRKGNQCDIKVLIWLGYFKGGKGKQSV
jgi:hypothetical protein